MLRLLGRVNGGQQGWRRASQRARPALLGQERNIAGNEPVHQNAPEPGRTSASRLRVGGRRGTRVGQAPPGNVGPRVAAAPGKTWAKVRGASWAETRAVGALSARAIGQVPRFSRVDGTHGIVVLGSDLAIGGVFRRPPPRPGRRNTHRFEGGEGLGCQVELSRTPRLACSGPVGCAPRQ
jgi:hypothetical protein